MGLLDDAIREHLELKKAHGASDDEVEQLEHEALGPARREAEVAERAPAEAAEAPAVADEEPAIEVSDPEPEPEPEPKPEPVIPTAEELDEAEPAASSWELTDEELEPEELEPEELEGEDVLEETPEFLQETPEHDRLWFEQKPPRDFDFDQ